MMTKKSYTVFAKSLGKYFREEEDLACHEVIDETARLTAWQAMDVTKIVCSNLKQDNPNFDEAHFREAIQEAKEED